MRINIDDTDMDDYHNYTYHGELFTGEIIETNPAGDIIELGTYRLGVEHGPQRAFYADGTLKVEYTADDNCAVGISRHWHHNGQLAEEREFTDRGDLVKVRYWTEDGSPYEPDPPGIQVSPATIGPSETNGPSVAYYAAIPPGRTRANPAGIVRRCVVDGHPLDEAFTRGLVWSPTTALLDQQFGHTDTEYVEISDAEAATLVHRISTKLRSDQR